MAGIQGSADALDNLFRMTGNSDAIFSPLVPEQPRIFRTSIKPYPSEFMAHSALAALDEILTEEDIRAAVSYTHLDVYKRQA